MGNGIKKYLIMIALVLIVAGSLFVYFRYFFTYEQRNVFKRKIGSITGMNLTVTVFGCDGRIVKRWKNVQKITTGRAKDDAASSERRYTFFYTKQNKYVQIPDSVWYIAEEE